jgi:hypothetical protein
MHEEMGFGVKNIDMAILNRHNQKSVADDGPQRSKYKPQWLGQGVPMSKDRRFDEVSQQLILLEQEPQQQQMAQHLVQPLSTRGVMTILSLESPAPLYRARRQGAAYWHKTANISQSKIVVPCGMRDKWIVFTPKSA